jgi:hypothetical protein
MKLFKSNRKPLPELPALMDSVKQEAKNIMWVSVAATALFAGLCGLFVNGWKAIIEGISIVIVAAVILVVTSAADWMKDKRYI